MKAASSRTRTRKFLAFAATTLAATLAFGTPTSARADDSGSNYPEDYQDNSYQTAMPSGLWTTCATVRGWATSYCARRYATAISKPMAQPSRQANIPVSLRGCKKAI